MDSVLLRFVQEGLANSFRHGKASKVNISMWRTADEIRVSIRDNGDGVQDIEQIEEGIGLSGMRERFGLLGGGILFHNVADGFELTAIIPYTVGELGGTN